MRTAYVALAAVLFSTACSDPATSPAPQQAVSFSQNVQPIFNRCVGCHGNGIAQQGLNLESGAYANTVNAPAAQTATTTRLDRIEPGNPDASYLLHKIQGTQATVQGSGSRMPLGQPALSDAEIQLIRRWISEGAANN